MALALKISAKGQVTLRKSVLAHLGVAPGQRLAVDLTPDGVVRLSRARTGKIGDAFGCLARPGQQAISIEEMNKVIAQGWAGEL